MNQYCSFIRLALAGVAIALSTDLFADVVQVNDFYYDVNQSSSTATLVRNASYSSIKRVEIPGKINVEGTEYTVTTIAQQAFQECKLESLSVGEGVKEIGKWAFYKCEALSDVNLPKTLTTVLASAFSKCTGVKTLSLPDNLVNIESFGFGGMTSLTEVTLPANLKTLSNSAFNGCSNLAVVNFNNGLETVDGSAFYGCGIISMSLPEGFKTIGSAAFSNCTKLKEITLPSSLTAIGAQAFYKCASLVSVPLPKNLKNIGMGAFYECTSLDNVTIPEDITFIDSNCFYGCSSLKSIAIPNGMTSISSGMFYNCSSLSNVKLHDNITEIGHSVFYGCQSLTSVTLPKNLKEISKNLFCRAGLVNIEIPKNVTTISDNAFYLCQSLKSLDIPENVDYIGGVTVLGCTSLMDINVSESNPVYADISGVLVSKDKTRLIAYPAGRKGEFVMPESITSIDGMVFNSNPNISGVVFSKNLKTIGASAFYGASGISEIKFPDSLESLGDMAFFMNTSIKSILLPNNDLSIGNNALSATGVSTMVFPEGITTIGIVDGNAFSVLGSCGSLTWLSLPSTLKSMSPLGSYCGKMSTIYSFAVEPPALVGSNQITDSYKVKVPKGSAQAYADAWKSLYPNVTFEDVLPVGPEVKIGNGSAVLEWEAYSDEVYTATPVRYEIRLLQNGEVVSSDVMEGNAVTGEALSYTFRNLAMAMYDYELKGYSADGQLTIYYAGDINLVSTGIEDIADDAADDIVAREYYDLSGCKVAHPKHGMFYIMKTFYANGKVSTMKHIEK